MEREVLLLLQVPAGVDHDSAPVRLLFKRRFAGAGGGAGAALLAAAAGGAGVGATSACDLRRLWRQQALGTPGQVA